MKSAIKGKFMCKYKRLLKNFFLLLTGLKDIQWQKIIKLYCCASYAQKLNMYDNTNRRRQKMK